MRVPRLFFGLVILVLLTAVGCFNSSDTGKIEVHKTENPNAEEILTLVPEADYLNFIQRGSNSGPTTATKWQTYTANY